MLCSTGGSLQTHDVPKGNSVNEHSISCEVVVGRVLCTNFGAGVAEDGVPVRYAHNIGWANGQPRLVQW